MSPHPAGPTASPPARESTRDETTARAERSLYWSLVQPPKGPCGRGTRRYISPPDFGPIGDRLTTGHCALSTGRMYRRVSSSAASFGCLAVVVWNRRRPGSPGWLIPATWSWPEVGGFTSSQCTLVIVLCQKDAIIPYTSTHYFDASLSHS